MYYPIPSESAAPSPHQRNLELFQLLELAHNQMDRLREAPGADPDELREWERIADKAREQLILANQGLVASMAKRYGHHGIAFEDLVAEGQFGLMTAIDKFDRQRGCSFSTHAFLWIKQAVTRAISKQARTIRIPEVRLAELRKVKKVTEKFRKEFGCEPSVEEIAWEMNLPDSRVRSLLALEQQAISIDAPVGDPNGATIIDFVEDSSVAHPGDQMDRSIQSKWLTESYKTLTDRECEVLKLRLGIDSNRGWSLEEIGLRFGVSRERIRQILMSAEEKTRNFLKAKEAPRRMFAGGSAATRPGGKPGGPRSATRPGIAAKRTKDDGLAMRSMEGNPNHHLWNNNGTWFCKFRVYTADGGTKSMNKSLKTKMVEDARIRRDEIMKAHNNPLHPATA